MGQLLPSGMTLLADRTGLAHVNPIEKVSYGTYENSYVISGRLSQLALLKLHVDRGIGLVMAQWFPSVDEGYQVRATRLTKFKRTDKDGNPMGTIIEDEEYSGEITEGDVNGEQSPALQSEMDITGNRKDGTPVGPSPSLVRQTIYPTKQTNEDLSSSTPASDTSSETSVIETDNVCESNILIQSRRTKRGGPNHQKKSKRRRTRLKDRIKTLEAAVKALRQESEQQIDEIKQLTENIKHHENKSEDDDSHNANSGISENANVFGPFDNHHGNTHIKWDEHGNKIREDDEVPGNESADDDESSSNRTYLSHEEEHPDANTDEKRTDGSESSDESNEESESDDESGSDTSSSNKGDERPTGKKGEKGTGRAYANKQQNNEEKPNDMTSPHRGNNNMGNEHTPPVSGAQRISAHSKLLDKEIESMIEDMQTPPKNDRKGREWPSPIEPKQLDESRWTEGSVQYESDEEKEQSRPLLDESTASNWENCDVSNHKEMIEDEAAKKKKEEAARLSREIAMKNSRYQGSSSEGFVTSSSEDSDRSTDGSSLDEIDPTLVERRKRLDESRRSYKKLPAYGPANREQSQEKNGGEREASSDSSEEASSDTSEANKGASDDSGLESSGESPGEKNPQSKNNRRETNGAEAHQQRAKSTNDDNNKAADGDDESSEEEAPQPKTARRAFHSEENTNSTGQSSSDDSRSSDGDGESSEEEEPTPKGAKRAPSDEKDQRLKARYDTEDDSSSSDGEGESTEADSEEETPRTKGNGRLKPKMVKTELGDVHGESDEEEDPRGIGVGRPESNDIEDEATKPIARAQKQQRMTRLRAKQERAEKYGGEMQEESIALCESEDTMDKIIAAPASTGKKLRNRHRLRNEIKSQQSMTEPRPKRPKTLIDMTASIDDEADQRESPTKTLKITEFFKSPTPRPRSKSTPTPRKSKREKEKAHKRADPRQNA